METTQTWARFERGGCVGGLYAATFGVNMLHRLQPALEQGCVVQTLPGLAAAAGGGAPASEVDCGPAAEALRQMAAAGCQLRIVSVHWGHEFEGYPTPLQMRVRVLPQRA